MWEQGRSDSGGKCVGGNSDYIAVASVLVGTVSVTFVLIEIVLVFAPTVLEQTEAELQHYKYTDDNSGTGKWHVCWCKDSWHVPSAFVEKVSMTSQLVGT